MEAYHAKMNKSCDVHWHHKKLRKIEAEKRHRMVKDSMFDINQQHDMMSTFEDLMKEDTISNRKFPHLLSYYLNIL